MIDAADGIWSIDSNRGLPMEAVAIPTVAIWIGIGRGNDC
jgi:hypothetical protein